MFHYLINLRIKTKITVILGLMVLSLAVISVHGLITLKSSLREARMDKISSIVHSYVTMAQGFQERVKSGELTQEEAIKKFYDSVRPIRFDDGVGYMFSYNNEGIVQLLGSKPELEGKDFSNLQDANGTYVARELIAASKGKNNGFFSYLWDKPGKPKGKKYEKLSYAATLPWGHHIGTGAYVDDIENIFYNAVTTFAIAIVLSLVIALGIGLLISNDLSRMISSLKNSMNILSKGDLTAEIKGADREDEIGDMAKAVLVFKKNAQEIKKLEEENQTAAQRAAEERHNALQQMADTFETEVGTIVHTVGEAALTLQSLSSAMSNSATNVGENAENASNAVSNISGNVDAVAASSEELSASVNEISRQVNSSSDETTSASNLSMKATKGVTSLSTKVSEIAEVVTLISGIAEQTNLLALNATIEAARAGDMGKGFAVVANEVKNLASQTAKATEQIEKQINAVVDATDETVEDITSINTAIKTVQTTSAAIAAAIEEQEAATREIASNATQTAKDVNLVSSTVSNVKEGARDNVTRSKEVLDASDKLRDQSNRLKTQLNAFLENIRQTRT